MAYLLLLVVAALPLWLSCSSMRPAPLRPISDYSRDVLRIKDEITELQDRKKKDRDLALVTLRVELAALTQKHQDLLDAKRALEKLQPKFSASSEALVASARLAHLAHQFEIAFNTIGKIPEHRLGQTERRLKLRIGAHWMEQNGRTRDSIELLKSSKDPLLSEPLGRLQFTLGNVAEADRVVQSGLDQLSPDQPRQKAMLHWLRGNMQLAFHRYVEAEREFERAIQIYRGYWKFESSLAQVFELTHRVDEAETLYRKILDREKRPQVMDALSDLLQEKDPIEALHWRYRAYQLYTKRIETFPMLWVNPVLKHLIQSTIPERRLERWADKNIQRQVGMKTHLLLAKFYLKRRQFDLALQKAQIVLANRWRTPETYAVAIMAAQAAKDATLTKKYQLSSQQLLAE